MLKNIGKFIFMIELGLRYVSIFKKTFFHPFITLKPAYQNLSKERQNYSLKVLEYLNIGVNVSGKLLKEDKVLYAINHRSLLDIIVIESILASSSKNGAWIAKQELFDSVIYGKFFEYSGCISVDLESKKGLLSFFKKIKKTFAKVDNMNLYMFPEGERFKGEGIHKFQSGAAKIAKANNLKIVPIYIDGKMEEVFEAAPYKEKVNVNVYIGDVISHETLEADYLKFYDSVKG
ncbi:1-acyl-sn-glycerol-3-phosphate acyltransferase [Sulfurimonas aquatica]|uniref:1-acyl-sn-glycerol-3-phosphate acyltransferase n=1 Tax=Sulfurimonas aquatica TaxID=2672570 RepID=A0A975B0L2_9BACT|nr:lysophospholipid acyltransferase family protein [Sulfurimonas aquatica]QSZ42041.1 1-acyl-sn-glycerol-3-phosphate acyltransferase [Sulfurimonas aquatica]